ncbi:MAG: permease-like cell division protein FtsX [Thermodesulfovibrionales bacterium]|nr:permease-like cell division protein FtsX [Thermodesulfovibrionales bacterium]
MALEYSFRSAFQSLWREKWINMLSMFTVFSGLLIISLISFFLYNFEVIANRLPERFSIIVYLNEKLSGEEINNVIDTLKKRQDVLSLKYISKDEALKEIKKVLRDSSHILEGLSENPLSSSVEIKLKKDYVTSSAVRQISGEIRMMSGVEDVQSGERIAEAIHLFKRSLQNISIIILAIISSGVIFVSYSTVKILFFRRKEEIDILKLLGATKGFIRAPFIIEGSVIGLIGGGLAAAGILGFYFAVTYRLSVYIPLFKMLILPQEILILLPLTGIMLGIIGSAIAIGRLKP